MNNISNELIVISEELSWKRNVVLKNLHKMETILSNLADTRATENIRRELEKHIKECRLVLEDIDEEDHS